MSTDLEQLIFGGESETLELKRSTGELREAMRTLCAFANGVGGRVVFGVTPSGQVVGQQVSEQTLHEIAAWRERFEPPIGVTVGRLDAGNGREVLTLSVSGGTDSVPCTYDGRAYERVSNTTRRMPRERYEALLLDRAHSRRRWENQVADEYAVKDIDREAVVRIVDAARSTGRLVGPVGRSLPNLLDRLGVRRNGHLLRAAVVLFGRTFLPDYPQCELRMARFRGVDKTEFLDQRHVRGPAFELLEEAELFCQRHFPLPGQIEPGKLQRVDRPLVPPDAMREILVNAIVHRDYSLAGGAVSLAIFDDRVEVWSAGALPAGITAESLAAEHLSVQRNPIVAEVFYRAGLIEKWGRGTNRVIEMCRESRIPAPLFREVTGALVVTFRVAVGQRQPGSSDVETRAEAQVEAQEAQVEAQEAQVEAQETRVELAQWQRDLLHACLGDEKSGRDLLGAAGYASRTGNFKKGLQRLVDIGLLELTIPDKPNSSKQRYRITSLGLAWLYASRSEGGNK